MRIIWPILLLMHPMSRHTSQQATVVVIGAGPVGLYLLNRLLQLGISCVVLEKEPEEKPGARAIGIHPPGLQLLAQLGIADQLIAAGAKVRRASAHAASGCLGMLELRSAQGSYPFVLSVPQSVTEHLLTRRAVTLDANAIQRDREVIQIEGSDRDVRVLSRSRCGALHTTSAQWLVACDGAHSHSRELLGIATARASANVSCTMGEAEDLASPSSQARVYLHPEGLVESFPLPNSRRRWVAQGGSEAPVDIRYALRTALFQRVGLRLLETQLTSISHFQIRQCLAERMVVGRCILAGDAAHALSPIGGQGMNLGWINASLLADALIRPKPALPLQHYQQVALRNAKLAARRADFNLRIGKGRKHHLLRDLAMSGALHLPPVRTKLADLFTMQGFQTSLQTGCQTNPRHRLPWHMRQRSLR